jgi:RNA polymerase sigma-70 factor, ECF subfamily
MHLMEIYDAYYQPVRRFILNTVRNEWVADDLVQETFIRINNNLETLKDAARLKSWIFRIAYNLCQDYFRSLGKAAYLDNGEVPEETASTSVPTTQKALEQFQMRQCVFGLVNHLPEPLRIVLILSDLDEFSQQEIADIVGISVPNVKIRLHRARKRLKILLEEHCVFEMDERNVLTCQPEKTNIPALLVKPAKS